MPTGGQVTDANVFCCSDLARVPSRSTQSRHWSDRFTRKPREFCTRIQSGIRLKSSVLRCFTLKPSYRRVVFEWCVRMRQLKKKKKAFKIVRMRQLKKSVQNPMGPTSTVRNRCKANGDFADFEGNLPDGFRWNNFRGCAPARVPFRTSCVIHKKRLACDGRRSGHGGGSRVWHWRSGSVCPEGVCKRNATALDGISLSLSLFFNPFICLCVSIYTRVFIVSVSAPSVQTNNRYCANRDGRREGLFTFRTQPSGPARKQSGTGRHCRRPGATQNHRNNPQNATNIRSKPRFATLRRRCDRRFTIDADERAQCYGKCGFKNES